MAKFDTLTVHAGYTPDSTGAVMPAIYATSTFAQPAPASTPGMNIPAVVTRHAPHWKKRLQN